VSCVLSNQIIKDYNIIVIVILLYLVFVSVSQSKSNATKALFNWRDAFNLESQLTDEEKMVRDQFRAYCDDKLMSRVLMANRNEGK